jgi:ribosome-binding protein aMBF1 (putative translation factor)
MSTNTRQEIATRLKQAREKAGYMSAEDFCEKNQLILASYRAFEQGDMPIKSSQAARYCKLLNISLYWLLLGEERQNLAKKKQEIKVTC